MGFLVSEGVSFYALFLFFYSSCFGGVFITFLMLPSGEQETEDGL
jgi:hypothetical protein